MPINLFFHGVKILEHGKGVNRLRESVHSQLDCLYRLGAGGEMKAFSFLNVRKSYRLLLAAPRDRVTLTNGFAAAASLMKTALTSDAKRNSARDFSAGWVLAGLSSSGTGTSTCPLATLPPCYRGTTCKTSGAPGCKTQSPNASATWKRDVPK